jgi:hypothetical protein
MGKDCIAGRRVLEHTEEDRLLKSGLGQESCSMTAATHCRNYLSSTTMNRVGMQLQQSSKKKTPKKNVAHTVTSRILNRIPRMFSSHRTPSFVAHWKAATQESLISLRYCTPFVTSTSKLGPVVSGPKHQIFLASVTSHPYSSARTRARILGSSRALILPSSISLMTASSRGKALV